MCPRVEHTLECPMREARFQKINSGRLKPKCGRLRGLSKADSQVVNAPVSTTI